MSGDSMLTDWTQEYVEAFFRSPKAWEPLVGRFTTKVGRDAFCEAVLARRFPAVKTTAMEDGVSAKVHGATTMNALQIVKTAGRFGGRILFPGALPRRVLVG